MGTESVRDQREQMLDGLLLDAGGVGACEDGMGQLHLHVAGGKVGDRTTLQCGTDQLPVLVLLQLMGGHNQQLLLRARRDVAPVQAAALVQQGGAQAGTLAAGIEVAAGVGSAKVGLSQGGAMDRISDLHGRLLQCIVTERGRSNRHQHMVGLQLFIDQGQQLLLTGIGIFGRCSDPHVGLAVGQGFHAVGRLDALELGACVAGIGRTMQCLALGELRVALHAQTQLANGAAVALDHILVASTLQIHLGIDGLGLAVVERIRLDQQMSGGILVLGMQTVGKETLQTRLQLMQLLRTVHSLLVGDVTAPGALCPRAGRSGDGTTCAILAQILEVLGLTLSLGRSRVAGQSEVFLDVLHLGESNLALSLVQAAYSTIVAAVDIRIVALRGFLAQRTQIRVFLLQQTIGLGMCRVVAHQAGLCEELRKRFKFTLRRRDLRIGRDLQHMRILQLRNGNPVADVTTETSVAGLGTAQLLQRVDWGGLLHQNNALIAEVGCGRSSG